MCFIISFSQYFLTLIIGGGNVITYPLVMFPYIQSGDRTLSSLYSIVFIIISLIRVVLIEKSLESYYLKDKEKKMSSVKIVNLTKSFNNIEILKNINIDINQEKFVTFLGKSVCGKSTTLKVNSRICKS